MSPTLFTLLFCSFIANVYSERCTGLYRQGSRGDCVKVIQRAIGTDQGGIFGPNTKAAVKSFQRAYGLEADGIVGPKTWSAIYGNSERCTGLYRQGSRGDCVKVIQRAVGTDQDGIFGPNTKAAVKSFQRAYGLEADGIVGPKTWSAIYGNSERCTGLYRQGSRGDCVKVIQRAVGTDQDGIFGPNTKAAVKSFQRAYGLEADGIVGPKTWSAIYGNSERCTGLYRQGSRGDCVKVIQRAVGTDQDGIFGPNTKAAVKSFQRAYGLEADGIVGPKTWSAIYGNSTSQPNSNGCGCERQSASGCSDGPTQGARNLAKYLKSKFQTSTNPQIYNCRKIRGSKNSYSLYAEGRAVDFFVTTSEGHKVFAEMKKIACSSGIQEVIWQHKIWTSSGEKRYGPSNHFIMFMWD